MNTRLDNKADSIKTNIAYNIIGSYLKGVAAESASIDTNMSNRKLGQMFCGEAYGAELNPNRLPLDVTDYEATPDKVHYLNNLVEYAHDKIDEFRDGIKRSRMSEEAKVEALLKFAKRLSTQVGVVAYSEGYVDEELKADITLVLNEGKERFIERHKEAQQTDVLDTHPVDAPPMSPEEEMMQGMGDPMTGGDMGMDPGMGFEEMPQDGMGMVEEPTNSELGFDDDFGQPFDDSTNTVKKGAKGLSKLNDQMKEFGDTEEVAKQGEGLSMFDLENYLTGLKAKGFGESFIDEALMKLNSNKNYKSEMFYIVNGNISRLNKYEVKEIADALVSFEDDRTKAIAKAEGASILGSEEYAKDSRQSVHTIALILTARKNLNL